MAPLERTQAGDLMEPTTNKQPQRSAEEREQRRRQRHEARAGATYREFLKLASAELGLPEADTECVLASVITTLEQRLPFDEMADLASELPYKLRELVASCAEPREQPMPRDIGRDEFIEMVARDLRVDNATAESHIRAVFRVLTQCVSRGEIEQVMHLLPRPLRALWPSIA